ncbi:MAG: DPP IV N-terminal domain-containing protein, partial [Armatimonadaceae bacterium]
MRLLTIAAALSAALLGTNPALSQTKGNSANLTPGIGVGAAVAAPRALPVSAQKRDLTLDEALGGGVRLSAVADAKIAWLDKSTYVVERGNSQFAYDAVSGEQRPLKPLAASPDPAPTGRFRRRPDGSKHPTGAYTVAVRDHDVYVTETKTSKEKRITKDGSPTIFNGALDWVYEEEVYGRGTKQVFQWSPDGRYLAFLRLDEAPVKRFVLVDHLPKLQKTEEEHYPKAGEPNPVAQLLVVDVTKSDPVPVAMDLGLFPDPDRLIVRFGFTPDSRKLIAQIQNKEQNK